MRYGWKKKKKRFGPMVWDENELKKLNIGLGIWLPSGPTWASKLGSNIYKKEQT